MFDEKVVMITGGASGIGAVLAEDFVHHNARVIIVDRDEKMLKECLDRFKGYDSIIGYEADVTDYERSEEIVEEVVSNYGKVDILINNAGITRDSSIKKMTQEEWQTVLDVNLSGAFNYTKHVFLKMSQMRFGRIINISSLAGIEGNFGQINYSAAKAGLIGMTKTIAREGALKGITANVVAPGFISTSMTEGIPQKIKSKIVSNIPMQRPGQPEEVSSAVKFFASEQASYISGQVLQVNGGLNM